MQTSREEALCDTHARRNDVLAFRTGLPMGCRVTTWACSADWERSNTGVGVLPSRRAMAAASAAAQQTRRCGIISSRSDLPSTVAATVFRWLPHRGTFAPWDYRNHAGHHLHLETAVQCRSSMVLNATHGLARGMVREVGRSFVCRHVAAG